MSMIESAESLLGDSAIEKTVSNHIFEPGDADSLLVGDVVVDHLGTLRESSVSDEDNDDDDDDDDTDSVVYLGAKSGGGGGGVRGGRRRISPDLDSPCINGSQTLGGDSLDFDDIVTSDSDSLKDNFGSGMGSRRKRRTAEVDPGSDQERAVSATDKHMKNSKKKKEDDKRKQLEDEQTQALLMQLAQEEDFADVEYTVEAIIGHKIFRSRVVKYHVKWLGYTDEDNTWEPATQLHEDVPDLCLQYWDKQKIKPINLPTSTLEKELQKTTKTDQPRAPTNPYARRLWEADITEESLSPFFRERGYKIAYDQDFPTQNTNWHKNMTSIFGIQKHDASGQLLVYCRWSNGHKTVHAVEELHQKAPDILARFYESRLHFED